MWQEVLVLMSSVNISFSLEVLGDDTSHATAITTFVPAVRLKTTPAPRIIYYL